MQEQIKRWFAFISVTDNDFYDTEMNFAHFEWIYRIDALVYTTLNGKFQNLKRILVWVVWDLIGFHYIIWNKFIEDAKKNLSPKMHGGGEHEWMGTEI